MLIRNARPEDKEVTRKLHMEMGIDYMLPDLDSPLVVVNKVVRLKGRVVASAFSRITSEMFLILDPSLKSAEKVLIMKKLQPKVMRSLWKQGIDEVECRIPEEIEVKFRKRLKQLKWTRNRGWTAWSHPTGSTKNA